MTEQKDLFVYFGQCQLLPGTPQGPTFRRNTNYICIDMFGPKVEYRLFESTVKTAYRNMPPHIKRRISLIEADASNTPLQDESADMVHIYNVLSGGTPKEKIRPILEEAVRIVKPDGIIQIGETNTPLVHPLNQTLSFGWKNNLLTEIMFEKLHAEYDEKTGRQKIPARANRILSLHLSQQYEFEPKDEKERARLYFNEGSYLVRLMKKGRQTREFLF